MKLGRLTGFFVVMFLASFGVVSSEPEITLISPSNSQVFSDTQEVNFSCLVDSEEFISSVTLYLNDAPNETETGGGSKNYFFQKILSDGIYNWTCEGVDGVGSSKPNVSSFTVNTLAPKYSQNYTNSTSVGEAISHKLYFQDEGGLEGYIFSFDNGNGIFVNDSLNELSGKEGWANVTKVGNSTPGTTIRWKIYVSDLSDKWNSSLEYSYLLKDLVSPPVTLNLPINESIFSSTNIEFNCSVSDNSNLANVTLYGNWKGGWHANETLNLSGVSNSTLFSKNIDSSGIYSWNCYSCDVYNNCDFSSINGTFILDNIYPAIVLVSPANNSISYDSSQRFRFKATDNLGIKNCSLYLNNLLVRTETSVINNTNTYFSSVNLSASVSGKNSSWYARCYDSAGSYNDSLTWVLTVIEEIHWIKTYFPSNSELSSESEYIKELEKFERIRIILPDSEHYVSLIDLTSSTATINVSSISQQKVFRIGNENKFDVTGNGYYDILVKLNSISDNKANITIKLIDEIFPASGIGKSSSSSTDEKPSSLKNSLSSKGEAIWKILLVIIFIFVVLIGAYFIKRKKEFGY